MKYVTESSELYDSRIIVFPMVGKPYYIIPEGSNETYGDVKDVIRPHLNFKGSKKPARHQLILTDNDGIVFSDDTPIFVECLECVECLEVKCFIFIKDVEWTDKQRDIIRQKSGENGKNMYLSYLTKKDEMEAFIWSLENISINYLEVRCMNIMPIVYSIPYSTLRELAVADGMISSNDIIALTDALRDNKTIERLRLQYNGISADDMSNFLKMVGENNVITELIMYGNDYRVKDLTECLRVNKSLRKIIIGYCEMSYDNLKEVDTLASVMSQSTLETLKLYAQVNDKKKMVKELSFFLQNRNIIHSLFLIDNEINFKWTNPDLIV
jgi:hypothetical protein